MKTRISLIVLVVTLLFVPVGFAANQDVWQMAKSDKYGTKFGGMLGRGLLNVVTCFVDVIVQTVEGTQTGTPFIGTLTGLGGGIGCTALRVSSGALDVATFWVPGFNGIPVGKSYSNCLEVDEDAPAAPAEEVAPASAPIVVEEAVPASSPMDYVKK